MDDVLYLDTARVGQMTPAVGRMLNGIVDLNHAIGSSLYFSDFLFGGYEALPTRYQSEFVRPWQGIDALKKSFSEFAIGDPESDVVFASRSANLISLATKMMSLRCRKVMVTDLNWPFYDQILAAGLDSNDSKIQRVFIEDLIYSEKCSADDLADYLIEQFNVRDCDGLLLPAISNRGVKLPIATILQRLAPRIRFSVIDAAQAFNHVDFSEAFRQADVVVGGSQKWLGAYEPLSIGIFPKKGSQSFIHDTMQRESRSRVHFDPLLKFGLEEKQCCETVNLNPLFTAAASLKDATTAEREPSAAMGFLQASSSIANWDVVSTHSTLNSNVVMLKPNYSPTKNVSRSFLKNGIAITSYAQGDCRLSFRTGPTNAELVKIERALIAAN